MLLAEHVCDVYRNQTVGTNGRRSTSQIASSTPCLALPMSAQASVQNQFDLGKGYDFYFSLGTDIKVKDKLVYNGQNYTVSGIQIFNVPEVGHLRAMAQQEVGP